MKLLDDDKQSDLLDFLNQLTGEIHGRVELNNQLAYWKIEIGRKKKPRNKKDNADGGTE